MSTQAPDKQPKITYSAIGGNMDEIHAAFDAALVTVRGELGKTHELYVNGQLHRGEGRSFQTRSPIDHEVLVGEFTTANDAQIDRAVKAAKRAQKAWGLTPWQERVAILRRAAENIRKRRYELAAIMSIEVGKSRLESLGDAEESADLIDYYADQMQEAHG